MVAPQDRKTVSCDVLEEYFAKDPHPDGKAMATLASKLSLNKKQVSNFFERSRRKNHIVVEPRRRTSNTTTSSSGRKSFPNGTPPSPPSTVGSSSRKRTVRGSFKQPDDDFDKDNEVDDNISTRDLDEDEGADASSSPERAQLDNANYRVNAAGRYATRRAGPVEHVPLPPTGSVNPLFANFPVRAASPVPSLSASGPVKEASSKPTTTTNGQQQQSAITDKVAQPEKKRKKRSASSVPLESPTVQFLKNPFPSPISMTGCSPDSSICTGVGCCTPTISDRRRRKHARVWFQRGSEAAASSSAALQAITGGLNSTPGAKISSLPLMSSSASSRSLNATSFAATSSDAAFRNAPYQREEEVFVKITHSVVGGGGGGKSARQGIALGSVLPSGAVWDSADLARPLPTEDGDLEIASDEDDDSYISEAESAYDEYESAAIRKQQQAAGYSISGNGVGGGGGAAKGRSQGSAAATAGGQSADKAAALRTTIACSELKAAFLANPHPAAPALDALASRLGLGKKQVSNYFVRERKKAGYIIKARHGLHARRRRTHHSQAHTTSAAAASADEGIVGNASNKLAVRDAAAAPAHPEVVVTQHVAEDEEEADEDEEDDAEGEDVEVDIKGGDTSLAAPGTARSVADDLPELGYDDSSASLRSIPAAGTSFTSSLMAQDMSRQTNMSNISASTDDDASELASPPFEATALPMADGKKGDREDQEKMLLEPMVELGARRGDFARGQLTSIA